MYNPYLSSSCDAPAAEPIVTQASAPASPKENSLSKLFKLLKPDDLDTGDILLLLILLLLFWDHCEDNLELIVAIGLMLIL